MEKKPAKFFVTHSIYYNLVSGVLVLFQELQERQGITREILPGIGHFFFLKNNIDKFVLYPSSYPKNTPEIIKSYEQVNAFYVTAKTELLISQFQESEMQTSNMDAKLVGKIGLKDKLESYYSFL